MGQVQSSEPDDTSCFRACLRDKKLNSLKQPAVPFVSNDQHQLPVLEIEQNRQKPQQRKKQKNFAYRKTDANKVGETSIEEHLQQSMTPVKGREKDKSLADRTTIDKQKYVQGENHDEEGAVLGLQSKFSSTRKTTIRKHGTFTRITSASEGQGTKSNWSKQPGSSEQTNNKSQGGSTESTGKSRNILVNKIEEIKQKYYERELQIEIYQNENQYEENLQENQSISPVPKSSIREVKDVASVRQKIVQKLNKRKLNKNKKVKNENKETQAEVISAGNQELELYSKDGLGFEKKVEDELKESGKIKKQLNIDQSMNQSIRSGKGHEISMEERIQFSGYSQQQTLHEIRECDEEQEDYKSKVSSKNKQSQINRSKVLSHKLKSQLSNRIKENPAISTQDPSKSINQVLRRSKKSSGIVQGQGGQSQSGGIDRTNKIFVF